MSRSDSAALSAPSIESMKAAINKRLDPTLRDEAATMNSQERIQFAKQLLHWGEQLIASARALEPLEKFTVPDSAAN